MMDNTVSNNKKEHNNIHEGHRQRMWSKYAKNGFDSFEPHEVLEMLLYQLYPRSDTNKRAHLLIKHFGSLENVINANPDDLINAGLTPRGAMIFTMYRSVGEYIEAHNAQKKKVRLSNSAITGEYCCKHFGSGLIEKLYVIFLDGNRNIIHTDAVAKGESNSVRFDTDSIVRMALKYRANAVVLCHNHPGGNVNPSNNDIGATNNLASILNCIDVPVIDHIICCGDRYESLFERGYLIN